MHLDKQSVAEQTARAEQKAKSTFTEETEERDDLLDELDLPD
jgi:hypothetical protein